MSPGDLVNFAARLRLLNGEVVSYEEFYIPRALLPQLEQADLAASKFEYLSRHGIEMVKTHQKLIPALAEPRIQELLDVNEQEPILINQSRNFCTENDVFEYSVVYYKSSLYDFEIIARA
ncbi:UTRA domain-containing protein [Vibrio sp. WXL103]|uniref:UTRA domain-containing protein n=1 Tax=Vibrio sp. WXL103 TaxID=3450710 RepID=UPI003EC89B96